MNTTNAARVSTPSPSLQRVRSALAPELAGRVSSARELLRRRQRETPEGYRPTSLPDLDRLLDGGLPRGELTELVGRSGSGRFAAVLAILAATTAAGEAAALVDLGDGLDPRTAAAAGIDLSRLLWLRPRRLQEALAAAEIALTGGLPLVALDLGVPPVAGGRGVEAAWLRLARAAQDHQATLLVASPYRVSGTAAATVVEAHPERATWSESRCRPAGAAPRLLLGLAGRFALAKRRGRSPGEAATLAFHAGTPAARRLHPEPAARGMAPIPGPWHPAEHPAEQELQVAAGG